MKKIKKGIKIKLLLINLLVGTGLVHLKKHDPHIHADSYRKRNRQDMSLVLKRPIF